MKLLEDTLFVLSQGKPPRDSNKIMFPFGNEAACIILSRSLYCSNSEKSSRFFATTTYGHMKIICIASSQVLYCKTIFSAIAIIMRWICTIVQCS